MVNLMLQNFTVLKVSELTFCSFNIYIMTNGNSTK